MATFIRCCAWCGLTLGTFEAPGEGGTTHTACDSCLAELLKPVEALEAAEAAVYGGG